MLLQFNAPRVASFYQMVLWSGSLIKISTNSKSFLFAIFDTGWHHCRSWDWVAVDGLGQAELDPWQLDLSHSTRMFSRSTAGVCWINTVFWLRLLWNIPVTILKLGARVDSSYISWLGQANSSPTYLPSQPLHFTSYITPSLHIFSL